VLLEFGWVIALPYGLFLMFTCYWELGLIYVLFPILVIALDYNPYGYTVETAENPPECYETILSIDGTTRDVCFDLFVTDIDTVNYDNDDIRNRDWVQAGFDWDGDSNPDYWTKFYYKESLEEYSTVEISAFHNFDAGEHTVNCWIRDNWGATSEPISFSFDLSKNNDLYLDSQSSSSSSSSSSQQSQSTQQSSTTASTTVSTTTSTSTSMTTATATSTATTSTTTTTGTSTPATTRQTNTIR
jgi:hypothetical protein